MLKDHQGPAAVSVREDVVERASPGPLWKTVSSKLLEAVLDGEFVDGFPGELELAQRYGVSRGTIRAALKPLRDAGHITAHPGRKPTVVAGRSTAYGPIYSVLASIRESGMRHGSVVLEQHLVTNPEVAEKLSLPPDAELFHLSRIRLADDEPIGLDQVWLPAAIAGELVEADFRDASLYGELDRRCGVVLDGGTEQLTAVLASPAQALLLGCAEGSPLLLIERTGCHRARDLEFRRSYVLGDRVAIATAFGCKANTPRRD
ncbi:MAG: GntR family transcriptional regulator [Arthrobacter sp.]|nr:GntR family transcriptional regulator [Arthrobacter sp.]